MHAVRLAIVHTLHVSIILRRLTAATTHEVHASGIKSSGSKGLSDATSVTRSRTPAELWPITSIFSGRRVANRGTGAMVIRSLSEIPPHKHSSPNSFIFLKALFGREDARGW